MPVQLGTIDWRGAAIVDPRYDVGVPVGFFPPSPRALVVTVLYQREMDLGCLRAAEFAGFALAVSVSLAL